MVQRDKEPWPPDDIRGMLAELAANGNSVHWVHLANYVYWISRTYGNRHVTYLDEADDIANGVLEILARPGVLESFGQPKPSPSASPPADMPHQAGAPALPPPTPGSFLAWIGIITRNVWIARLRYHSKRPSTDPLNSEEDENPPLKLIDDRDITEFLIMKEKLQEIYNRLRALLSHDPASARKVIRFLLGGVEGMPYREVAERLHCTESQVRQSVFQIRQSLRDLWDQAQADAPPVHAKRRKDPP